MSFRIAEKQALKSSFGQHRVGAVIVKNGRVLSVGYNERRYSKHIGKETIHAEESAVVKLLTNGAFKDLAGADIYVTRFTHGGRVGMAAPCDRCQRLLAGVGIRRAFYSSTDHHGNGVMQF